MARDGFNYAFIIRVRECIFAGYETDADIGKYACGGASARTVKSWRLKYPEFNRACERALMDVNIELSQKALDMARAGDASMVKFLLERRNSAFKPRHETTVGPTGALAELLKMRMSDQEARDRGLILDVPEDVPALPVPDREYAEFAEVDADPHDDDDFDVDEWDD